MGKIEKVGNLECQNLDIRNYLRYLDIEKYPIDSFKISSFEVGNVEMNEIIQFNTNYQQNL